MTRRRQLPSSPPWAGQVAGLGVALTLLIFSLPSLTPLSPLAPLTPPQSTTVPILEPLSPKKPELIPQISTPVPAAPLDENQEITLLRSDGTTETLSLSDYLFGVVAAEMPASFQLEALKAQAVAARTYVATRGEHNVHPEGTLCDDSGCCQAYIDPDDLPEKWGENTQFYTDKIRSAVAETDGLLVYYEGQPIEALFFAAAAGRTVDAQSVWGNEVSYLVGVNSPEGEEVPNYHSQVRLTKKEVEAAVFASFPTANLGTDQNKWLQSPTYTPSGSIDTLEVGGLTLSGGQVRSLFALRSASFSYHWEGSTLVFNVTGYGHGVGMSQYGANALASEGKDFKEILTWYYTGTTVE